jgi:hypothetical protein
MELITGLFRVFLPDFIAYGFLVASAIWIYYDASKLKKAGANVSPLWFSIGSILAWIVFFPAYLIRRQFQYKKQIRAATAVPKPDAIL